MSATTTLNRQARRYQQFSAADSLLARPLFALGAAVAPVEPQLVQFMDIAAAYAICDAAAARSPSITSHGAAYPVLGDPAGRA